MANLTRRQWSKGWMPNMDQFNGDREALVRMDNLMLDETGVLSLSRGSYQYPAGMAGQIHTMYSKFIDSTKFRFVGLTNGEVNGGTEAGGYYFSMTLTGSQKVAAFGSANGHIICCSGKDHRKFPGGTSDALNLTPPLPDRPEVVARTQVGARLDFLVVSDTGESAFTNWTIMPNDEDNTTITDNTHNFVKFDSGIERGTVEVSPLLGLTVDTFLGGSNPNNDTFRIGVRAGDTSWVTDVEVLILLDTDEDLDEDGNPITKNYFKFVWLNNDEGQFKSGKDSWSTLSCHRGDFQRMGDDSSRDWRTITGIRVTFHTTQIVPDCVVADIMMWGGAQGPIYGTYQYAQVNVYNPNLKGAWKSELSAPTDPIYVFNGAVEIKPSIPTMAEGDFLNIVQEIWIYRRDSGLSPDAIPLGTPRKLDKWYRVLREFTRPGMADVTFIDVTSDDEALELNEWWNESLQSLDRITEEDIIGLETDINGHVLYLTPTKIYISDLNDPGLFDSQATIQTSGNYSETNLWIKKPSLGVIYVGASNDIYEISGTFQVSPDGYLDVQIKPLGLSHPPIGYQVTADNTTVFYMSNDGLRMVGGAEDTVITQAIDQLFHNVTRYTLPPVRLTPRGFESYPVCIARDKLWVSVPILDGTRRLFVYSLKDKYWRSQTFEALSLFFEEDGRLLAGKDAVWEIDDSFKPETHAPRDVYFETVFDDDNLPRNRKDTFTFKIQADTGNKPVEIWVARNGRDNWGKIGAVAFDGLQEKLITIVETVGLCKSMAVRIIGSGLSTFKLFHFTIEYDPRPEQLTYLRIPYTNLGTASRKRFVNFAFVIDTLGEDCEFIPLIDGSVAGSSSSLNFARKATHVHYFDSEQVGTDIGGIICGLFEYYGPNLDEIVSEKMPVPTTFLVIPQNDFGVPNRKRHSSYKFVINTRGNTVRFTPRLDGINRRPLDFITNEKQVVEYFFDRVTTLDYIQGTIAINIGGTLESMTDPKIPFEFYGPIIPQEVEVLPARLQEFRIPENNYGVAARKRIRTMPFEIYTYGFPVTFTPIVDGVKLPPSTQLTATRQTVYHFFDYDVFGTDFCGELMGDAPFEFYGLLKPEGVEVLPVPKRYDQIGPIRLDKLGKLQAFRLRMITFGSQIPFKIINEDDRVVQSGGVLGPNKNGDYSGLIFTKPNQDYVYEVILPKTVNGTLFRIELGPTTEPFHRYDIQVKLVLSGMEADPKWVKYA